MSNPRRFVAFGSNWWNSTTCRPSSVAPATADGITSTAPSGIRYAQVHGHAEADHARAERSQQPKPFRVGEAAGLEGARGEFEGDDAARDEVAADRGDRRADERDERDQPERRSRRRSPAARDVRRRAPTARSRVRGRAPARTPSRPRARSSGTPARRRCSESAVNAKAEQIAATANRATEIETRRMIDPRDVPVVRERGRRLPTIRSRFQASRDQQPAEHDRDDGGRQQPEQPSVLAGASSTRTRGRGGRTRPRTRGRTRGGRSQPWPQAKGRFPARNRRRAGRMRENGPRDVRGCAHGASGRGPRCRVVGHDVREDPCRRWLAGRDLGAAARGRPRDHAVPPQHRLPARHQPAARPLVELAAARGARRAPSTCTCRCRASRCARTCGSCATSSRRPPSSSRS